MHLLIVASDAEYLVNFRSDLIAALIKRGHTVSTVAPDFTASTRQKITTHGAATFDVPLQRTGTSLFSDLSYMRGLKRLVRTIRPDLVFTYTIKPNIWGGLAAHAEGVPSVSMLTGLGYAFSDIGQEGRTGWREKFTRRIARRLYRRAASRNTLVVFQNPDDLRDFSKYGCLDDQRKAVLVNGSGVDLEKYARIPLPREPVFLMIARLLRSKGVKEYAEAARLLRETHPEARCRILGPYHTGPDAVTEDEFRDMAGDVLEYLGKTDDVRPHIARARVYVLPSYREGTPRSVLEAMAMGRPIITCDSPGCRETVPDGRNGILVPTRDAPALAAAMRRFLDNPDLADSMGDESWQLASRRFDVHLVNETLISYLETALESAGQRGPRP